MVSVTNLTVQFGGKDLFKDVTFLVNARDRIGLVGKNGAGKSTLLKVLIGMVQKEYGTIVVPHHIKLGYLPQELKVSDSRTVFEEALTAFSEHNDIETELAEVQKELEIRTDYETDSYSELIDLITDLNDKLQMLGSSNRDAEVEMTLLGLGFKRSDFHRPTAQFSGGWRMRIELAKILLKRPNVFLLDEPTNHLDIESIQWLEEFLRSYKGAMILISHDRRFLDTVTNRTIEISLGKIYDYKAAYSRYLELRQERRENQMQAYLNQQKMIAETEEFIERFRYKATKAVQVQSRIKQLDKVERLEVEEEDKAAINFHFPPAPRSGREVVVATNVIKKYGEKVVLNGVNLNIERGEKVALVGKNGEGKTTFIKCLMDEVEYQGTLTKGHNVHIGYFAQNQDELLPPDRTVFEVLDDIAVGEVRKRVRDILGSFLFSGEDVEKKARVLSGGERNRLAMSKLLLEPYNLLVLDEPTNHLDIKSKEILKNALLQYDGTVILVSHDRDFLEGLVSKVYEFGDTIAKEHLGSVQDFLDKKKMETFRELEATRKIASTTKAEKKEARNILSNEEKQLKDRETKRLQTAIKKAEENIQRIEAEMANLTEKINDPKHSVEQSLYIAFSQLQTQLETEMNSWEKLGEELGRL